MSLPQGWQIHPQDPRYMWCPQTNEVVPVAAADGDASTPQYGALNADDVEAAFKERAFQGGDVVWIKFPPLASEVGSESYLLLRLLPPALREETKASVMTGEHRLPADVVPNAREGAEYVYVGCFDVKGGPGKCPVDKARLKIQETGPQGASFAKATATRLSFSWQAIDLEAPDRHWMQSVGEDGVPIVGQDGKPVWTVRPGIVRLAKTAMAGVVMLLKNSGNMTDPDGGYPVKIIQKKVGPLKQNVNYHTIGLDRGPIDPSLRPVLENLVDLRQQVRRFLSREDMDAIAERMLERFQVGAPAPVPERRVAPPSGGQWVVHPKDPSYEYDTATKVIRKRQAEFPASPPPSEVPPLPGVGGPPPPSSAGVAPPPPKSLAAPPPPSQASAPPPPIGGPGAAPPLPGPGMPGSGTTSAPPPPGAVGTSEDPFDQALLAGKATPPPPPADDGEDSDNDIPF